MPALLEAPTFVHLTYILFTGPRSRTVSAWVDGHGDIDAVTIADERFGQRERHHCPKCSAASPFHFAGCPDSVERAEAA